MFTKAVSSSFGAYLPMPSSSWLTTLAKKANVLALGALALYAASNLPVAEAGAGSYWGCVQTCVQSMGPGWASTFICPTICAPFLAFPGG